MCVKGRNPVNPLSTLNSKVPYMGAQETEKENSQCVLDKKLLQDFFTWAEILLTPMPFLLLYRAHSPADAQRFRTIYANNCCVAGSSSTWSASRILNGCLHSICKPHTSKYRTIMKATILNQFEHRNVPLWQESWSHRTRTLKLLHIQSRSRPERLKERRKTVAVKARTDHSQQQLLALVFTVLED